MNFILNPQSFNLLIHFYQISLKLVLSFKFSFLKIFFIFQFLSVIFE